MWKPFIRKPSPTTDLKTSQLIFNSCLNSCYFYRDLHVCWIHENTHNSRIYQQHIILLILRKFSRSILFLTSYYYFIFAYADSGKGKISFLYIYILMATKRCSDIWTPSIFRAILFGSWVITHSLEIDDFHVHLAAVYIK